MPTPPDFTNGTALEASSLNSVGLWKVASGSFSGTTNIDGIFTSAYDNYRIVATGMSGTVAGLSNFRFRNTSNATDSSNVYYTAARRFDSGTNYDFSQGPLDYATTAINVPNAAFAGFVMDIFTPRLTAYTVVNLVGMGAITAISTVQSNTFFNGTTAFAGIQFTQSSGSLNAGTYTVFGYRKG
jgi:hypothetical protein